jgi:predicted DNA-binding transcriptional regulator YafY
LKDGRVALSMTASGKEEIKAWIMNFGAKAEVISPRFLKEEIRKTFQKL